MFHIIFYYNIHDRVVLWYSKFGLCFIIICSYILRYGKYVELENAIFIIHHFYFVIKLNRIKLVKTDFAQHHKGPFIN